MFFDPDTCTEPFNDYISIFKDATCISYWGSEERLSGGAESGWPGAAGRPPLVIPADHFYLHFHSDASTEDWGYKITATAPVSIESASQLKAEDQMWDEIQCQMALQQTNNNYEAAKELLVKGNGVVPGAETTANQAASEEAASVAGLFCDRTGAVQVNLQTSEVRQLQNRCAYNK